MEMCKQVGAIELLDESKCRATESGDEYDCRAGRVAGGVGGDSCTVLGRDVAHGIEHRCCLREALDLMVYLNDYLIPAGAEFFRALIILSVMMPNSQILHCLALGLIKALHIAVIHSE